MTQEFRCAVWFDQAKAKLRVQHQMNDLDSQNFRFFQLQIIGFIKLVMTVFQNEVKKTFCKVQQFWMQKIFADCHQFYLKDRFAIWKDSLQGGKGDLKRQYLVNVRVSNFLTLIFGSVYEHKAFEYWILILDTNSDLNRRLSFDFSL